MLKATSWTARFLLLAILVTGPAVAGELPSADSVFQIYRENRERLSRLHLQYVYRYETTEASCRADEKRADEKEKFFKALSQMKPEDAKFVVDNKPIEGEEARRMLAYLLSTEFDGIERYKGIKPFTTIRPGEFFTDGENYQFRQPLKSFETEDELNAWTLSETPVTAETLLTTYREMSIFSRSSHSTPAARWLHHSADRHAYIMNKHLTEVSLVELPPFTDVVQPRWDNRHHIDAFFSQPAEKYRVVREEEIDGRLLTVVDVAVRINPNANNLHCYRGWLDLTRGAIPLKLNQCQGVEPLPDGFFDRFDGRFNVEIITTEEVRELPNGAFYPARTMTEIYGHDPDDPNLKKEELDAVRAGTKSVNRVVHRRHRWDCSLVEVVASFDDEFFVIPFPEGQKLYDHDAGKIIGGLEKQPLVRAGQQAPPLTVARWLDGQERTLEDFRGQVVVLDFWGLWCSACRNSIPTKKLLQDKFKDQPVVFISVHTAEKDAEAAAEKIEQFAKAQGWNYLAAIDSGTMLENSVTSHAYGVEGFPAEIIIGADGLVRFNSNVPPPGFEDLFGKDCEELTPEDVKRFEEYQKKLFELAGEDWPLPETLSEEEVREIHSRVGVFDMARRIDAALAEAKTPAQN